MQETEAAQKYREWQAAESNGDPQAQKLYREYLDACEREMNRKEAA